MAAAAILKFTLMSITRPLVAIAIDAILNFAQTQNINSEPKCSVESQTRLRKYHSDIIIIIL